MNRIEQLKEEQAGWPGKCIAIADVIEWLSAAEARADKASLDRDRALFRAAAEERLETLAAENKRLTEALREAPHAPFCHSQVVVEGAFPTHNAAPPQMVRPRMPPDESLCGCWKRAALKDAPRQPRCTSRYTNAPGDKEAQCFMPEGHGGSHAGGGWEWGPGVTEPRTAPVQLVSARCHAQRLFSALATLIDFEGVIKAATAGAGDPRLSEVCDALRAVVDGYGCMESCCAPGTAGEDGRGE